MGTENEQVLFSGVSQVDDDTPGTVHPQPDSCSLTPGESPVKIKERPIRETQRVPKRSGLRI